MQVGDDLMELGARCHHDGCNRQDYLPFHCDACAKPFCCEHRSYEAHNCEEGKKKNIVVPRCPDCDQLLSLQLPREVPADRKTTTLVQNRLFSLGHSALDWGRADDPDFMKSKFTAADVEAAIERHRSAGCAGPAQAKSESSGRKLKQRCRFGACKKREYMLTECQGCHTKFCTGHRHASDHSCGNSALLRPKKTKRAQPIASSAPMLPAVAPEPRAAEESLAGRTRNPMPWRSQTISIWSRRKGEHNPIFNAFCPF